MNDPIVEEIRRFRWEHTQRFQSDLAAICADLRTLEQQCGHPVVHFEPKPATPVNKDTSADSQGEQRGDMIGGFASPPCSS